MRRSTRAGGLVAGATGIRSPAVATIAGRRSRPRRRAGVFEHAERGIPIEDAERPDTRPDDACAPGCRDRSARSSGPWSMPKLCSRASGKTASLRQIAPRRSSSASGSEQEAVAPPRERAQQPRAPGGVRVRIVGSAGRACRARTRAATRARAAAGISRRRTRSTSARGADRQHGRELVVGAVGEPAPGQPVDP